MTPEKIRIAIAEACGWENIQPCTCCEEVSQGNPPEWTAHQKHLPNYPEDLNACHEAEQLIIDQGLQDHWLDTLVEVVVGKNVHWSDYHCFPQVNRATAPQRCEAFLKTMNLWIKTTNQKDNQ